MVQLTIGSEAIIIDKRKEHSFRHIEDALVNTTHLPPWSVAHHEGHPRAGWEKWAGEPQPRRRDRSHTDTQLRKMDDAFVAAVTVAFATGKESPQVACECDRSGGVAVEQVPPCRPFGRGCRWLSPSQICSAACCECGHLRSAGSCQLRTKQTDPAGVCFPAALDGIGSILTAA
jgi:hypothetical protein